LLVQETRSFVTPRYGKLLYLQKPITELCSEDSNKHNAHSHSIPLDQFQFSTYFFPSTSLLLRYLMFCI